MGRRKGFKKKKDRWESLPTGYKEAIDQSSTDEIKKRISTLALAELHERAIMKVDPAVLEVKEKYKNVMEPYRSSLKSLKLQLEYAKKALDDKDGGASTAKAEESTKAKVAAGPAEDDTTIEISTPDGKTTGPLTREQLNAGLGKLNQHFGHSDN